MLPVQMQSVRRWALVVGFLALAAIVCVSGQGDYDEDGNTYQGANSPNQQGDADSYNQGGNGYANDNDGYSNNQPNYNQNVDSDGSSNSPSSYQNGANNDDSGDYEGDDNSAAASQASPTIVRLKRSATNEASAPKIRVKRHGKHYIGPVYTYVKTDKHANFKWGVKHKVGKHHG